MWGPEQEHSLHLQFSCPLNAIHHLYWGKLDFNVTLFILVSGPKS